MASCPEKQLEDFDLLSVISRNPLCTGQTQASWLVVTRHQSLLSFCFARRLPVEQVLCDERGMQAWNLHDVCVTSTKEETLVCFVLLAAVIQ